MNIARGAFDGRLMTFQNRRPLPTDNKGLVSDRKGNVHMELAEHWRWCYRDAATGRVCRTSFQLTAEEADCRFRGAERIEGSMTLREVDIDALAETAPRVFHASHRPVS